MGYYSEVAIVVEKEREGYLLDLMRQYDKTLIEQHKEKGDNVSLSTAENLLSYAERKENAKYVVYHWADVKWYDYFPSVSFFDKELPKSDIPYDFIRTGEEAGDIETREGLSSEVLMPYVVQSIDILL